MSHSPSGETLGLRYCLAPCVIQMGAPVTVSRSGSKPTFCTFVAILSCANRISRPDLETLIAAVLEEGSVTDRGGRPLTGLQVRAAIGRPSTDRFDLTVRFIEVAPGRYEARDTTLAAGNWIVALEARTRSGDANPDFRLRRKLWLAP